MLHHYNLLYSCTVVSSSAAIFLLGMYECVCLFSSPHASFFLTSSLSFYPSLSCIYPLSSPIYLSHVSLCVSVTSSPHFLSSLPLLSSSLSFARYRSRLLRRHGRSSPCSSHISSQSTRGPIEVYIPTSRHRHGLSACSWQRAYQRCPHPLFMGDNPIHWLV